MGFDVTVVGRFGVCLVFWFHVGWYNIACWWVDFRCLGWRLPVVCVFDSPCVVCFVLNEDW